MRRRAILCGIALALSSIAGWWWWWRGRRETPARDAANEDVPEVVPQETLTLDAMLLRLLPSGGAIPGAPGARETGVRAYIEGQLRLPEFAGFGRMIRDGLKELDRIAKREHGVAFSELPGDAADHLLKRFQNGHIGGRFPAAQFFAIVLAYSLEGYLGDPRYGGNRDQLAWQWLGISATCGHP